MHNVRESREVVHASMCTVQMCFLLQEEGPGGKEDNVCMCARACLLNAHKFDIKVNVTFASRKKKDTFKFVNGRSAVFGRHHGHSADMEGLP